MCERSQAEHLVVCRGLIEALPYKETFASAPNQRRESAVSHQSGSADVAEILATALNESNETFAFDDEVRRNVDGDELKAGRRQPFQPGLHIL